MINAHMPQPPTKYRFAGHVFGFAKIDERDRYTSATLDCRLVGQLEPDPEIAAATRHFGELVGRYPGELVLFDGPRLVISDPPQLDQAVGGVLRLRFRQTSYFTAALCRGVINGSWRITWPRPGVARFPAPTRFAPR